MGTNPIKIAILAMGGEGGGVLADWIVDLGEHNGHLAQTTSIPGVAQRTGATIYYVELYPRAQAEADGGRPVLALMPLPGDVDVVLASELMEAGRAVQRGLVTPERTTLIASTHRVYSIAEKSALGDGRVDSSELLAHAERAALRFVRFDMADAAAQSGSVISAVLFGALAGAGVLPFGRAAFEATIERGGVGVKASLKAFGAAFERARAEPERAPASPAPAPKPPQPTRPETRVLVDRIAQQFPADVQPMLLEGARRLVDYQDPAYAGVFLDRMQHLCTLPCAMNAEDRSRLARTVARHLAVWMSYEDTIRVAELKTRGSRFERVRDESQAQADQVVAIHEYMHPRLQEIAETLPWGLGPRLLASGWARRLVERFTQHGRVIETSSLHGFVLLYTLAGLKRWRRSTLRYHEEDARIAEWLADVEAAAAHDPALAVELAQCQRLVKGYGDTHARGLRNYRAVIGAFRKAGGALAPATLRELRDAALADEHGTKLNATLARHALAP
jgi:indolepyruvate ferredoxin oxidoreductase beta subunit